MEHNDKTLELLEKIEQAETRLFAMGFTDFRVRIRGSQALLQLPEEQLPSAREDWTGIQTMLKEYFTDAVLDEQPRRSL